MVRRFQRRGWMSRGQTRRSLPHKSRRSQKPATPCSTKMNTSCGRPLTRLTRPVVKARAAARARLQSVRRGDIRDHPYLLVFIHASVVLVAKVVYIILCHKNDEKVCYFCFGFALVHNDNQGVGCHTLEQPDSLDMFSA